jgi:hypothetical protein
MLPIMSLILCILGSARSYPSKARRQKLLFLMPLLAILATVSGWGQEMGSAATAQPGSQLWRSLFDGKSMEGWQETPFTERGKVRIENGTIILGAGLMTGITRTGDYPRGNFEVRFEAVRLEGNDFFVGLTFPVGASFCTLIVGGWGGGTVGLSNVDGWDASSNQTYNWREFDNDRWYAIRLRVTDEQIRAWIDEEPIVNLELEGHVIKLRYGEIKLSRPFGFASYMTTAGLRKLEYRILPGSASATGR